MEGFTMAVAKIPSGPDKLPLNQSGSSLFEICERLRLSSHRYEKAEKRYVKMSGARATKDGSPGSFQPSTALQGLMRPGTKVTSIEAQYDPDFVYKLSKSHAFFDSIKPLVVFYFHLKQYVPKSGTLGLVCCLRRVALQFSCPKLRSCLFSNYASYPQQTIDCRWNALDLILDPVA
jgi:hypothetical protein